MRTTSKDNRLSGLVAILGLLALLVGLIIMILLPSIRLAALGTLLVGIILLATAFTMDFRQVGRALTGRRGRYGTAATVTVSIFIGIILLVNAISIGNFKRFDVTGVAQFTLTSQTKDVLSKIETPVEVLSFFTPDNPVKDYTASLLNEYQNYTSQLSIKTIDPDLHPDQARQYGITEYGAVYGTVIFESESGQRAVYGPQIAEQAEHAFTSALLEVTGIVQKKVYFLTGHGESDIYSDYNNAREGLLDNLYQVGTLDLLYTHEIPEDLAVLVIAAPRKAFTSEEIALIHSYLEDSGRVLILLNPNPPQDIKQLLSSWGVDIEDGNVIDPSSYAAPNMDSLLVPRTRNFLGLSNIYFPGATAIIPQPSYTAAPIPNMPTEFVWTSENTEIEMYSLIRASQDSWLERSFDPNKEPQFNEGVDREAPLHIGFLITTVTAEETEGELPGEDSDTRLIVFGDSDFASNQHYYNGNNEELFLNTINLLSAGTELVSIERKVLPFRRLVIGPEAMSFIRYSSVLLLPLLVLLTGGVIWWRRRQ